MLNSFKSRYTLLSAILFLYLLPIVFFSYYTFSVTSPQKSWEILSWGLFCTVTGTTLLFLLTTYWEWHLKNENIPLVHVQEPTEPLISLDDQLMRSFEEERKNLLDEQSEYKKRDLEIQKTLEEGKVELDFLRQENGALHRQLESVLQEFSRHQEEAKEKLQRNEALIHDSQKTISDQRALIEVKHQMVSELEAKVRDLTYEIKTLLQLAEIANQTTSSPPNFADHNHGVFLHEPVANYHLDNENSDFTDSFLSEKKIRTQEDAIEQLKRCIDTAQKITGANHYRNGTTRLRELPVDNYALDLRRLFDSLRSEKGGVVVFYSQKENRLLFVNNQIRNLLGWSPEKFLQNFLELVVEGLEDWRNGISQLAYKNETKVLLVMKSKSGEEIPVEVFLGIVPTGIFRHHVMGVFYTDRH